MTDMQTNDAALAQAELEARQAYARTLGVEFRPTLSLEKLNERIAEKEAEMKAAEDKNTVVKGKVDPVELKRKAMALVRVRVSSMNPAHNHLEGDLFTFGNTVLGTKTRYVKFNEDWHIEQILLDVLKSKRYQTFVKRTHPETKVKYMESVLKPTYAIEVLPALTEAELKELAQRQAMASGTQD